MHYFPTGDGNGVPGLDVLSEGESPPPLLFYIHTSESALSSFLVQRSNMQGLNPLFNPESLMDRLYALFKARYSAGEGPWLHQPAHRSPLTASEHQWWIQKKQNMQHAKKTVKTRVQQLPWLMWRKFSRQLNTGLIIHDLEPQQICESKAPACLLDASIWKSCTDWGDCSGL